MIRRLGPDDWTLLRALRLDALVDAPSAFGSSVEREQAFTEDEWRHRLRPDGYPTFVWEADGDVGGMVVAAADPGDTDLLHLVGMWVHPAQRRDGVGGALVGAVLESAEQQGRSLVRLHVTEGNGAAERLYERHGFTRTGRAIERPRDGLREIEMERRAP